MKNKIFFKKYFLILLLSFIAVFLGGIKLFYKTNNEEQNKIQKVNIQIQDKEIINNKNIIIETEKEYPLNKILPYIGENFDIKQYTEPLTLVVKVKIRDQNKITNEMKTLFEKNNVDINSHKFDWQN